MDLVYLMPALMFVALALLLFSGFPVAWVLGGVGIGFAGARVKILPLEIAIGVLGYDAAPVGNPDSEDSGQEGSD